MITGTCHCGQLSWTFDGIPESATACNCTFCRRHGTLWAYDVEGEAITVAGPTSAYAFGPRSLAFHFCPTCASVAFWRSLSVDEAGRRRIAVNLRLADPEAVAAIPVEHFDGLNSFADLGQDGRTVGHMWF